MTSRIISKIKEILRRRSSESYIKYLRTCGVSVGEGTYIQSPKTTNIDITRPSLVTIGNNCFINNNFEIYTHDWLSHVFLHTGRELINCSGRVTIGNNVAFGAHVMILKGVTIGDNCFIGAGSIVTKDIPSDSIAVGAPAKVVTSIEEYYQKRLKVREEEAFELARSIVDRFGRKPLPSDFKEEFPLFVNGKDVDKYPEIPIKKQLGPIYEKYCRVHVAKFNGFNAFLKIALGE